MEKMSFKFGTYGSIASKDLERAQREYLIQDYGLCCEHCQQCLEKILKEYLLLTALKATDKDVMQSHSLKRLANVSGLKYLKPKMSQLSLITDYYFETRYPNENYTESDEESAREVLDITETIFSDICESIKAYKISEITHEFI